jgi:flagellar hook-basal body complex protein FliE
MRQLQERREFSTEKTGPFRQPDGRIDPIDAFGDILKEQMNKVNSYEANSRNKMNELASGKTDNVHDVMIALEKSKIALNFTVTVRNKALEAYKEIMRIQL